MSVSRRKKPKRLTGALGAAVLALGSLVVVFALGSQRVRSGSLYRGRLAPLKGQGLTLFSPEPMSTTYLPLTVKDGTPCSTYLPLAAKDAAPRSFRVGYCMTARGLRRYPDISGLAAGWYSNFNVALDPPRPGGIEHIQTLRLHQLTTCWPNRIRDRNACPYVVPYTYTLTNPSFIDPRRSISRQEVASVAVANPGSLWLIGNEMDRYDWGVEDPHNPGAYLVVPGGQDEMLPGLYAQAYHELYHLIKGADPTALVAIGGVIQATEARLWYVDTVWHTYQRRYGTDMPVDVWNVHNFILKEHCDDYGADIPPGCPPSVCRTTDGVPCHGEGYSDKEHNDMEIFAEQIVAFRRWMKEHGQQDKPLIVSEYGILYYHAGMEELSVVREFMLDSFRYFLTAKDPELGYWLDENRLVQRWAWFSLDSTNGWNKYSYLMDPETRQPTALGRAFKSYTHDHLDVHGSTPPAYWP